MFSSELRTRNQDENATNGSVLPPKDQKQGGSQKNMPRTSSQVATPTKFHTRQGRHKVRGADLVASGRPVRSRGRPLLRSLSALRSPARSPPPRLRSPLRRSGCPRLLPALPEAGHRSRCAMARSMEDGGSSGKQVSGERIRWLCWVQVVEVEFGIIGICTQTT